MFGQTQASSDYQMAKTILNMWALYRMPVIIAFGVALLLAIFFFIRKSSWGKWFLFLAFFLGAIFVALDGFKMYVHKREKAAFAGAITAPLTAPVNAVGRAVKGLFGFGQ